MGIVFFGFYEGESLSLLHAAWSATEYREKQDHSDHVFACSIVNYFTIGSGTTVQRDRSPATGRLYVHLLVYPLNRLTLKNMADKVKYVQFLHDASEINISVARSDSGNDLVLSLPVQKPPVEIPVLEVYLK